jgi:hypothetical protein
MGRTEQLNDLIHALAPSMPVPADMEGLWRIFRAHVNTREPKPVSAEFLAVQDELGRLVYKAICCH